MKKLIVVLLAVLCLTGCGNARNQLEAATTTVTKTPAPVVETPVEEPPVQEFEVEIEEALPEDPEPGEGGSVAVPVESVEGLVGDAVGYSFQKPVFTEYAASEKMNENYAKLVDGLVEYAEGKVNETCLNNNCVASVYGTVLKAELTGEELAVTYECRVEYSGDVEGSVNVRIDVWNVQTGEVTSKAG